MFSRCGSSSGPSRDNHASRHRLIQETEYKEVLARVEAFAEEEGRRPRILVRRKSRYVGPSTVFLAITAVHLTALLLRRKFSDA